jgi:hypothetical protein
MAGERGAVLDQAEQIRAAGDEGELRSSARATIAFAGSSVLENEKGCMAQAFLAALAIASTMLG